MKLRPTHMASALLLASLAASSMASHPPADAPVITTFAGNADANSDTPYGEGGPAVDANIVLPQDVAIDPAGNVYIADYFGGTVWQVDRAGTIRMFAGDQAGSAPTDGGLASDARIGGPRGVATGPDGTVYIAVGSTIYRVTTDGLLYRHLVLPGMVAHDVDAGPEGSLYISDTGGNVVRHLARDGTLSVFAGTGLRGNAGDGGAATTAELDAPLGVLAMRDGSVLVSSGDRVRRIAPDGTISTFAGGGADVAATSASAVRMGLARGLARDAMDRVYVADLSQHLVRRIDPDGSVAIVVGSVVDEAGANAGYAGDGGPAAEALIGSPRGMAIHGRSLYIVDQGTRHVRRVAAVHDSRADRDLDGDGAADIVWRNATTGGNAVWLGGNAREPQRIPGVLNTDWDIVAIADFDDDGISDLFWRNRATGANALWPDGAPWITPVRSVTRTAWRVVGAGDFDGDGHDDLFWRDGETGANAIWPAGAPGHAVAGVRNLAWSVVGVGDFDADGRDDVLWRNLDNGRNVIWRGGDAADQRAVTGVTGLAWQVAGVGDVDADGRADVVWWNSATGANVAWGGALREHQLPIAAMPDLDWAPVAIADYDNDGYADLLWRNESSGANVIWRATDHHATRAVRRVPDPGWRVAPGR